MMKLTPIQIATIQRLKPQYVGAETLTGVPWPAIAAVHYREASLQMSVTTPGGPYQFDPVPSTAEKTFLFSRFTKLGKEEIIALAERSINDFDAATLLCACWLRHNTKFVLAPGVGDAAIKDAFWGYNGRAYGSADQSPYVMNGFDDQHMNMHMHGTLPDGHGGRKVIDTVDQRMGAFTVYTQIRELNL